MAIYKLSNTIQNYDWGTTDFIPKLINIDNNDSRPCAELWMGAHPKAPSRLIIDNSPCELDKFIAESPNIVLGRDAASIYNNKLPFLFKVLSASKALSIQAHPDKKQAKQGFDKENMLGIDLESRERNYKDDNHKPELILALSPFIAMCGFRSLPEIQLLMELLEINDLFPSVYKGYEEFFKDYINTDDSIITDCLMTRINEKRNSNISVNKILSWCLQLYNQFGKQIGILAPLFLNIVKLNKGEAIYLKAGVLHAYLQGSGLEIMANSDNVLRAGLTSKHIDKIEILKVLSFEHHPVSIVNTVFKNDNELVYKTDATEFELSCIFIKSNHEIRLSVHSAEIILCTEGNLIVNNVSISKGQSLFVSADEQEILINGDGILYRAKTPCR